MTVVYVSRYSLYIFIASERMLIQVFEKKLFLGNYLLPQAWWKVMAAYRRMDDL